jgi:hypothetical protein
VASFSTEYYSKANKVVYRLLAKLSIEIIPGNIKEGSKVIGYFSHIAVTFFVMEMQLV